MLSLDSLMTEYSNRDPASSSRVGMIFQLPWPKDLAALLLDMRDGVGKGLDDRALATKLVSPFSEL